MIRAVLDTNVFVSSLLTPAGVPGKIVKAWSADAFVVCISEQLLLEIEDVLMRPAIRRAADVTPEEITEFLDLLVRTGDFPRKPVEIPPIIAEDPDDDVVLATAIATEADVIVTGDRHLLDLARYQAIPILSPRQFLDVLAAQR